MIKSCCNCESFINEQIIDNNHTVDQCEKGIVILRQDSYIPRKFLPVGFYCCWYKENILDNLNKNVV